MDKQDHLSALIDHELAAWPEQFGGGMVPFDLAYFRALREGQPTFEAQRAGASALLDAFASRVKKAASTHV